MASSSSHVAENSGSDAMPRDSPTIDSSAESRTASIQPMPRGTISSTSPYTITINRGEDVYGKIMELALQAPHIVAVWSAQGKISCLTLVHPNIPRCNLAYKELFDIRSFSGTFFPVEMSGSVYGSCGKLAISVVGASGRTLNGVVSGLTLAATPVKVVLVTILPFPFAPKPQTPNPEPDSSIDATDSDDPQNPS